MAENEIDRILRQQGLAQMMNQPNLPILGKPVQRRWKCPVCKDIPVLAQFQPNPAVPPVIVPDSIATQLPDEPGAVFLCAKCNLRDLRSRLPALVPIDADGNPLPMPIPGFLRAVPHESEEQS